MIFLFRDAFSTVLFLDLYNLYKFKINQNKFMNSDINITILRTDVYKFGMLLNLQEIQPPLTTNLRAKSCLAISLTRLLFNIKSATAIRLANYR